MKVREIRLGAFGKFKDKVIEFDLDAPNIVLGENEAGKSTLFESYRVLMTGFSKGKAEGYRYTPWGEDKVQLSGFLDDESEVERKLMKSVSGRHMKDGAIVNIRNNPIVDMNGDILKSLYTLTDTDLDELDEKALSEVADNMALTLGIKGIRKPKEVAGIFSERAKDIFINRRNSEKKLNIVRADIKKLKSEKKEYFAAASEYREDVARLSEIGTLLETLLNKKAELSREKEELSGLMIKKKKLEKVDFSLASIVDIETASSTGTGFVHEYRTLVRDIKAVKGEIGKLESEIERLRVNRKMLDKGLEGATLDKSIPSRALELERDLYLLGEKSDGMKERATDKENDLLRASSLIYGNRPLSDIKRGAEMADFSVLKSLLEKRASESVLSIEKMDVFVLALIITAAIVLSLLKPLLALVLLFAPVYMLWRHMARKGFIADELAAELRRCGIGETVADSFSEGTIHELERIRVLSRSMDEMNAEIEKIDESAAEVSMSLDEIFRDTKTSSASELALLLDDNLETLSKAERLKEAESYKQGILDDNLRKFDELRGLLGSYEAKLNVYSDDMYVAADILERDIAEYAGYLRDLSELGALGDYDDISREVKNNLDSLTDYHLEGITSEIEDINDEIASLSQEKGKIEGSMKVFLDRTTPDEMEGQIISLKEEEKTLSTEYDKNLILEQVVRKGYDKFIEENQPAMLELASGYISRFTEGRYVSIMRGEDGMYLRMSDGSIVEAGDKLSRGTKNQVYLAMRLAIISEMEENGEKMPLFFDEAFGNWDEERLSEVMESLKEISSERQVVIMTCRKAEAELYREMASGKIIYLGDVYEE